MHPMQAYDKFDLYKKFNKKVGNTKLVRANTTIVTIACIDMHRSHNYKPYITGFERYLTSIRKQTHVPSKRQ